MASSKMASRKIFRFMTQKAYQDFILYIAQCDIKSLLKLKRELEQNWLKLLQSINTFDKEIKKLHNTLEKVGEDLKGIIQTSIENMQNAKKVSSKFYYDITSKIDLLYEMFPIFKVDKEGDKSLFYNRFFSSRKERYIVQYMGSIYYFSDRECTDLKGEIKLNGSEQWEITGCNVTITQPDRVWEISFASEKDAGRFQEICKQE